MRERVQQMRLNSKVTWGLAWTGLAVVLAVPSADFLTGTFGNNKAGVITSTTEPGKTDTQTPPTPATTTAAPTTTTNPYGY